MKGAYTRFGPVSRGAIRKRCKQSVRMDGRTEADSRGRRKVRNGHCRRHAGIHCRRLPIKDPELAFAVQGQSYGPMLDEKLAVAAWKAKPTWAVISTKDQMLPPGMEESVAKKMSATTTLSTCHMSILEEPAKVTAAIDDAAKNALNNQ